MTKALTAQGYFDRITSVINSPEIEGQMMLALGHTDGSNPAGKNEARRYASSVLSELNKLLALPDDDKRKELLLCNPQSIAQCMIDATRFRLMIDGRQHAHLIKYKDQATLQIGFRGYIAKVAEHYDNCDLNVFPVFKGDNFKIYGGNGFDEYEHVRANPFNDKIEDFEGVAAVLYYTKGDQKFQKIITMSKTEIGKVKNAAKVKQIWDAWFFEKAKVAAVKRICKLQFASISILQEMVNYDNSKNYDMEKTIAVSDIKPGSIIDNLNDEIDPPDAPTMDDIVDADFSTVDDASDPDESESPPRESGDTELLRPPHVQTAQNIVREIRKTQTLAELDTLMAVTMKNDLSIVECASIETLKWVEQQEDIQRKKIGG